ncbi:hypothetical protein CEQ90_15345 [Lewinellaceae bacterium SD302]|nr:hypothetical protein CEQ90_15345 [Lewinellaceae bacterium SD302]
MSDHLGNTVVLFEDTDQDGVILDAPGQGNTEVLQRNLYYPFGLELNGTAPIQPETDQNYLYNGKEQMEGTGLYAYGFRYYDPTIGRFTGVDPIADQFAFVSPFNYAENSPIANIDLHGLQAYYAADGSLLYKVKSGQGPTQIAQDLTLNFGVPTGWQRIVNHPDNAGYFSHIVGPGRSDMNNPAYRALNMNEGNILKIAGPPTGRTLYPSSQNAVDFSADDETFFNQTINLMQKFSVENRLNGGDFLESGKYSATSFLSNASKRNGALDFYFGSTDQFGLTTYKTMVRCDLRRFSIIQI